jgi:hypothetical protein
MHSALPIDIPMLRPAGTPMFRPSSRKTIRPSRASRRSASTVDARLPCSTTYTFTATPFWASRLSMHSSVSRVRFQDSTTASTEGSFGDLTAPPLRPTLL